MSKKKFLPPLKEGNQDDIESYKVLTESLRSHPDMSKFRNSIEAKNIVKFVTGIRKFQDKHLGKDVTAWPMVRLPDTFFRDRSSKGPLYTIMLSIYRQLGANASIDESDDASTDCYEKTCEVLKQVEADLVQAGLLIRPIVYFDETVSAHHDLSELETLVTKFGGKLVTDPSQASHVVAHDEEVDSVQALAKQKRNIWEKQFLRTVAVVRKDAKSHSALVHWWFWPTSSDEWMPAEDVAGIVEDPPVGPDGGPLVVACKFVRDVAKFNEWGVEADYAIEDYQEKVALYNGTTIKTGKKGGRRGRKGAKRGPKSKSPDPSAMQAGGDASKASVDAEKKSIAGAEDLKTSLKRERNSTMEPRFLNTGYYGIRGEKIRHLVHVGALLMPTESLDILDHLMSSTEGWVKSEEKDPSEIELPGLDAVLRPSEDKENKTITVTELSLAPKPAEMSDDQTTALKTVERTRRIDLRRVIDGPERIRGGGGDGSDGTGNLNAPQPMEIDKPSITTPAPAASVPEAAKPTLDAAVQGSNVAPTTGMTQVPTLAPNVGVAAVSAPTPTPTVPVAAAPVPTPAPTVPVSTAPASIPAPTVGVVTAPSPTPAPTVGVATVPVPKPAPPVGVTTAQPLKPVPAASLASTPAPVVGAATTQVTPNSAAVTAQVPKPSTVAAVATAQAPKPIPAPAGATAQVLKPAITAGMATVSAPKPVPAAGITTPALPGPSSGIPATAPPSTANKIAANQPVVAPKAIPTAIPLGSVSQSSAPKSSTLASKPVSVRKPTPTKTPVPPSAVSSSKVASTPTPANVAAKQEQVIPVPLPKRPASHWEQHIPGAQDDTAQEPQMKTPKPSWYDAKKISDFEQQMLPEWFDKSARHRTPASYLDVRERSIEMSEKIGNRYLTATMVRRSIPGDAGSLLRMHNFLVAWGFINEEAVNDSAPTAPGIREISASAWRSIEVNSEEQIKGAWNEQRRGELLAAVMEQSNKRQKVDHEPLIAESSAATSSAFPPINWDAVAEKVGNGASSVECEREFLSLTLDESSSNNAQMERSTTPDHTGTNSAKAPDNTFLSSDIVDGKVSKRAMKEQVIRELVDGANPEVVKAATDAAIKAAESLPEAQKSSVLGIMASEAAIVAKKEEESVSRILGEIMEQRMSKLENRLALLDDVEGMLEAERVALELERRDLYTARCRFWFQGN